MMNFQPFTWGANGQKASPSSVKKHAEIAAALAARGGAPQNFGEGLNRVGEALLAKSYEGRAAAGEEEGAAARKAVMDALLGNPDPTMQDIAGAMGNEWVTSDPGSSAVLQALMGAEMQQNDPLRQLQIQAAQQGIDMGAIELDQLRNPPAPAPEFGWQTMPDGTLIRTDKTSGEFTPMGQFAQGEDPTSAIQNYEYLIESGIDPTKAQEMAFGGGQTTINNVGNIPAGYELFTDPATGASRMQPIAGSPAALEAQAANDKADMRMDQAAVVSDTIVNEASKARAAMQGFGATGPGNWLTGGVGFTPAGQLNQHVSALKSIAAAENINAMRQASPTGGALGNASDADIKLLQDKAGALDPQSPQFGSQLDDYERTLLRIVHGPEAGDRIFEQTREGPRKISTEEEYQTLPSGTEFEAPDGSIRVKP